MILEIEIKDPLSFNLAIDISFDNVGDELIIVFSYSFAVKNKANGPGIWLGFSFGNMNIFKYV